MSKSKFREFRKLYQTKWPESRFFDPTSLRKCGDRISNYEYTGSFLVAHRGRNIRVHRITRISEVVWFLGTPTHVPKHEYFEVENLERLNPDFPTIEQGEIKVDF